MAEEKTRERLGLNRAVQHCEPLREGMYIVALECGHWRKSHDYVQPGTVWGCTGCDALQRLTASAPWNQPK